MVCSKSNVWDFGVVHNYPPVYNLIYSLISTFSESLKMTPQTETAKKVERSAIVHGKIGNTDGGELNARADESGTANAGIY